jgi:hypothetical protein
MPSKPRRRLRVTSGGSGPRLSRQVDPSQRTPPAARMASGSGHEPPPALQKRLGDLRLKDQTCSPDRARPSNQAVGDS